MKSMNKKGGVKLFGYFMLALIISSLIAIPFTIIPVLITAAISLCVFVKKKANPTVKKAFGFIVLGLIFSSLLFVLVTQSIIPIAEENGIINDKTVTGNVAYESDDYISEKIMPEEIKQVNTELLTVKDNKGILKAEVKVNKNHNV